MEMLLIVQGKNDPPKLPFLHPPVVDLSDNPSITFCVIEAGMVSGEPSVMIVSSDHRGTVLIQTSLDKFMAGASGMASAAEFHWGWKRPEGHFTLMPPDAATRKIMLEAIKKELEDYDS